MGKHQCKTNISDSDSGDNQENPYEKEETKNEGNKPNDEQQEQPKKQEPPP